MSLFVLDTDHLTLYYRGDPIIFQKIDSRLPTDPSRSKSGQSMKDSLV